MKTVLANSIVTEEKRVGAHQAVVVQGLHHGDSAARSGIVNGWRPQGKEVLNVKNVMAASAQSIANTAIGLTGPDRSRRRSCLAQFFNAAIVLLQQLDLMPHL